MSKEYYVKEGRSITSRRGVIGPGGKVSEKDFTSGESAIKGLLDSKNSPITDQKPKAEVEVEAELKARAAAEVKKKAEADARAAAIKKAEDKVDEAKQFLKEAKTDDEKTAAKEIFDEALKALKDLKA